jgi:hypothetical protein
MLISGTEEYMHQVTVIEPKWLSEVAPTFFRVADQNKISKRKASEKIEPLFDRFAPDKDAWVRHIPFSVYQPFRLLRNEYTVIPTVSSFLVCHLRRRVARCTHLAFSVARHIASPPRFPRVICPFLRTLSLSCSVVLS